MEQLIKCIVNNQKLKDIGSVARGADRVFAVYCSLLGKSLINPLVTFSNQRI